MANNNNNNTILIIINFMMKNNHNMKFPKIGAMFEWGNLFLNKFFIKFIY